MSQQFCPEKGELVYYTIDPVKFFPFMYSDLITMQNSAAVSRIPCACMVKFSQILGTLRGPDSGEGGMADPVEIRPSPFVLSCQIWSFNVKRHERQSFRSAGKLDQLASCLSSHRNRQGWIGYSDFLLVIHSNSPGYLVQFSR